VLRELIILDEYSTRLKHKANIFLQNIYFVWYTDSDYGGGVIINTAARCVLLACSETDKVKWAKFF
jgi:hypothetical protein